MSNNEPLAIRAGRYMTRDGRIAVVTSRINRVALPWPWIGRVENFECWSDSGRWSNTPSDKDLVARLPDPLSADDRIERALQVLREVQTHHSFEAAMVDKVRKILEEGSDD